MDKSFELSAAAENDNHIPSDAEITNYPENNNDCNVNDSGERLPEIWHKPYVDPPVKEDQQYSKFNRIYNPYIYSKARRITTEPIFDEWKSVPYPGDVIVEEIIGVDYNIGTEEFAQAAQFASTGRPLGGLWGNWKGDTTGSRDKWKEYMEKRKGVLKEVLVVDN